MTSFAVLRIIDPAPNDSNSRRFGPFRSVLVVIGSSPLLASHFLAVVQFWAKSSKPSFKNRQRKMGFCGNCFSWRDGGFQDARDEEELAFPDCEVVFVFELLLLRREKNREWKLTISRHFWRSGNGVHFRTPNEIETFREPRNLLGFPESYFSRGEFNFPPNLNCVSQVLSQVWSSVRIFTYFDFHLRCCRKKKENTSTN